jgi:glycosyltransferase involved in cell wall biosynthesis
MKVSYDSFVFRMQKFGGISRYFENLIQGFRQEPMYDIQVSLFEGVPAEWQERINLNNPSVTTRVDRLRHRFLNMHNDEMGSALHLTYYSNPLKDIKNTELILTLHDFSPEDYPIFFPNGNPHLQKLDLMKQSSRLICVSNFTADRAIHYLPEVADRIVVIPLATTLRSLDLNLDQVETFDYMIAVGRADSYKNYETVIRVWLTMPHLKLMLFGIKELPARLALLIPEERKSELIFMVGSDEELRSSYLGARFLLNASYCEGFSIPMLEAMSLGCPAIGGPLKVYHELYGDSVLTSKDFSVKSFKEAISLLDDPIFRLEIQNRGLQVAAKYSWAKTLNSTSEVYKSLK